jgi:hypothetical protein
MQASRSTPSVQETLGQLRRARDRIAELEHRAICASEYEHAIVLHDAGEALDNVIRTVASR